MSHLGENKQKRVDLELSFVTCPLCGKMSSLRLFNPQALDQDIYIQNVKGLGRARGFKVINRESALGIDSVVQPIKNRLIDLVVMMNENDLFSKDEISEMFGFKEEHDALITLVADALEEYPKNWELEVEEDGEVFGTLRYGIERLIEDYQVLKASRAEEDVPQI